MIGLFINVFIVCVSPSHNGSFMRAMTVICISVSPFRTVPGNEWMVHYYALNKCHNFISWWLFQHTYYKATHVIYPYILSSHCKTLGLKIQSISVLGGINENQNAFFFWFISKSINNITWFKNRSFDLNWYASNSAYQNSISNSTYNK